MTLHWIVLSGCFVIIAADHAAPYAIGALYQMALQILFFCVVLAQYQDVKETNQTGI